MLDNLQDKKENKEGQGGRTSVFLYTVLMYLVTSWNRAGK